MRPLDELLHALVRSLGHRFDRTVRAVADPAGEPKRLGALARIVAEIYALHAAEDLNMDATTR